MAKRHRYGNIKGSGDIVCRCDDGGTYTNCGANCECCDMEKNIGTGMVEEGTMAELNPAMVNAYGFTKMYDGRIRGGIKTPEAPVRGVKEFNIFDERETEATNVVRPVAAESRKRIIRVHPLDIAGARRKIGQTVYDPISRKWKVDDGRARGLQEDEVTGQVSWACWGKCKVRKGWFGASVKCNCRKSGDGCACQGCMGGSAC